MTRFFCGLKRNPTVPENLSDSFFLNRFFKLIAINTLSVIISSFSEKQYCFQGVMALFIIILFVIIK